jgi:putative ABC transport system permease protein
MNPLWRKAPLLLLRFPALFASFATAALLLALAAATGPLFVSSAASSALGDELEDATRFGAGASVVYESVSDRLHPAEADPIDGIRRLDAWLVPPLRGVRHVDSAVFTALGATAIPGAAPGPSAQRALRFLARTSALAHVTKVSGRDGAGFWIADEAAESMHLRPGDDLYVTIEEGLTQKVRIDGIYRALWKEAPTPYWRSLSHFIYERDPDSGPPPTFLIGDPGQVAAISGGGGRGRLQLRWEWPLDSTSLTLDDAEVLARQLERFQRRAEALATRVRVTPGCEGCSAFSAARVSYSSLLPTAISEADETVSTLRGPADLLTTAGVLVALAVVGAAAAFATARRRVEVTVLFARGASAMDVGARAAVEALLPVLLGALAGLILAIGLVGAVGPGPVAQSALVTAAEAAGLVIPAGMLLAGVVAALLFALTTEWQPRRLLLRTWIPWEVAVLVPAGVLLYLLRTRGAFASGAGAEPARPSLSALLFPFLFTAGTAGIAARGLRRGFGRLRAPVLNLPPAPYLAIRRLSGAGGLAVLLVTACALSLGTFVYAQAVARSLEATVEAKSLLFVGSDVQGLSDYGRELPDVFPLPVTKVTKLVDRATLAGTRVDVMAVEAATVAKAAYFDDSWADESLEEMARALAVSRGPRLPVILAGAAPEGRALEVGGLSIPITVVRKARAFPGMSLGRALVVTDRAAVERAVAAAGEPNPLTAAGARTQIWVRGQTEAAVRALRSSTLRPFLVVTAEEVRDNPHIRSVVQTFSYLKALGLAAGILAVAGIVLYAQARQRRQVVPYALARRMGLGVRAHRLSLALELGLLLVAALLIGAVLAVVAARLVIVELDAVAELPSGPLFRTPYSLIGAALVTLIGVSSLGALLADRRARRANIAEVMRADE